ncbi:MAG TPA: DUF2252 domain-containing protein [Acidimicrobiales bacterium]|nr:DUF2252 domain-containing protein [Acidimicrobiales bacterium]
MTTTEKTQTKAAKKALSAQERAAQSARLKVEHIDREQGTERGRAVRKAMPRSSHADWIPPSGRRSPVDILAEQATTREPDLIPIRHGRMMVSPFTFFRGAAAVMAADLAHTPTTGMRVQLCGDAHLLNFGGYASPERELIFDVNDFDETLPGSWEWDVKRLAASVDIAARQVGFTSQDRRAAVERTVRGYRTAMREFAAKTELDVWYAHLDAEGLAARVRAESGRKITPVLDAAFAKARTKDSMKAFAKLTSVVDGQLRITPDPPLVVPLRDLVDPALRPNYWEELQWIFRSYRRTLQGDRRHLLEQYRMVDMARKVVGVGSVGTRCWIILLMGRDDNDPLFIQVKEAQDSVLAPFAGKSKFNNQGQRVVEGQRLMQAASDIFLGWIRVIGLDNNERDFYVRQLWDWKISVNPDNATPDTLGLYGEVCGWTLASGHARSGDRIAIASYLGGGPTFDVAVTDFAEAYAAQNERDYAIFTDAVKDGVLEATMGL